MEEGDAAGLPLAAGLPPGEVPGELAGLLPEVLTPGEFEGLEEGRVGLAVGVGTAGLGVATGLHAAIPDTSRAAAARTRGRARIRFMNTLQMKTRLPQQP